MKLDECRKLKGGETVLWSIGNGWYAKGTFKKMVKVTRFPSMTLSDLMSGNFSLEKGKEEWMAEVEYINDRGIVKTTTIRPRKLQKGE